MTISVLDGVTSLIDKSLLRQPAHDKNELRLYPLEMIREYGLERLAACGELEQTRDAHAAFYLALAEEAESVLPGASQIVWQERLEREVENVRAAMEWLLERGRTEEALRMAAALKQFSITYHSDELAARSTEPLAPLTYVELTAREVEVLRHLSMGLSNKQIAERLVLSPHTVSGHIQSIYGKLALNSRSAATRYALEHHLA
jgi:DNA-binding CsgD family transcriptional regulator